VHTARLMINKTKTNCCLLVATSGIYKICTNPGVPQAEMLFFRLRGLLVAHVERVLAVWTVAFTQASEIDAESMGL
jgi:hypothetical protein